MSMNINSVRDEPGSHITMCTGRWRMDHVLHVCNNRCQYSTKPQNPYAARGTNHDTAISKIWLFYLRISDMLCAMLVRLYREYFS